MTAIKKYRELHGMTQAELGKKIGVVPATITQYETGARKPDIITLKRLSVILNCTTDDLLRPIDVG